jgi:hypothetical protein
MTLKRFFTKHLILSCQGAGYLKIVKFMKMKALLRYVTVHVLSLTDFVNL